MDLGVLTNSKHKNHEENSFPGHIKINMFEGYDEVKI